MTDSSLIWQLSVFFVFVFVKCFFGGSGSILGFCFQYDALFFYWNDKVCSLCIFIIVGF